MKRLVVLAAVLLAGCSGPSEADVQKPAPPKRTPVGAVVVDPDTAGFPQVMLICEGSTLVAISRIQTYGTNVSAAGGDVSVTLDGCADGRPR
jgi:hypothetical protein